MRRRARSAMPLIHSRQGTPTCASSQSPRGLHACGRRPVRCDLVVTAQAALSAAATLVAVAFTFCTLDRWVARRRRHDLAWTVALAMFAIASGALWLGSSV